MYIARYCIYWPTQFLTQVQTSVFDICTTMKYSNFQAILKSFVNQSHIHICTTKLNFQWHVIYCEYSSKHLQMTLKIHSRHSNSWSLRYIPYIFDNCWAGENEPISRGTTGSVNIDWAFTSVLCLWQGS